MSQSLCQTDIKLYKKVILCIMDILTDIVGLYILEFCGRHVILDPHLYNFICAENIIRPLPV